ncbi:MAG TPA: T9SS type A sorting domain-containing protein [Saprospiraceae bacterium]|nr:T9SS type A sorting domain-containing protein [Saprospiraceae bacterium]HPI06598.1 T9SS type A sorting domain-containing protein [Saprospiraceae bacterium]
MKGIFLFSMLLYCITLESQITLEHTYPYTRFKRGNFPGAGERYYGVTVNNYNGYIYWFDGNHQPVKTNHFSTPSSGIGSATASIFHVSSDFFDADAGIEYIMGASNGSLGSGYGLQNATYDDTDGRLTPPFESAISLFRIPGGNKIVGGGSIYSVPNYNKEYTFPQNSQFGYVSLLNEGGKFWYYYNRHWVFLNEDYTVFRELDVDFNICAPNLASMSLLGQFELNDDEKLEVFNSKKCDNVFTAQYYSDSDRIFIFQDSIETPSVGISAATLLPSRYPGLNAPKCWIEYKHNISRSDSTFIYDILTGVAEHKLTGSWTFKNSDISGLKYARRKMEKQDTAFQILNPDYTVWASFKKDTSSNLEVIEVAESTFDADPDTKEVFCFRTLSASYVWQVLREDGTILFELERPFGTEGYLDQTPGLKKKLIFTTQPVDGTSTGPSYVYSLPDPPEMIAPEMNGTFQVLPNPFSNSMTLDLSHLYAPADGVYIYDTQGHLMYQHPSVVSDAALEIPDAAKWPGGLYLIRVSSAGKSVVQKAIRIRAH